MLFEYAINLFLCCYYMIYPSKIKNIFNLLSLKGSYRVIGSAQLSETKYASDYDLEEYAKEPNPSHVLEIFQQKFLLAEENPNLFITDFKCGVFNNAPLRWNKTAMKRGKQKIGNKWISFEQCLMMKSTIKLDLVALINGTFTEFSENYYLKLGKHTTYDTIPRNKQQISLLDDAKKLFNSGKAFKSLKRIYSYLALSKMNPVLQSKLMAFFNSDVGLLNKNKTELEIILLVLSTTFRKPKRKDVILNLQLVKDSLKKIKSVDLKENISETIDLICKQKSMKEIRDGIQTTKSYLSKKINEATKSFLDGNKILLSYIQ